MEYFLEILITTGLFAILTSGQALVLNRAGLSFAGITLFMGIGGYGLGLYYSYGIFELILAFGIAMLLGIFFALLSEKLPKDLFLIATLVMLVILRAIPSSFKHFNYQVGLSAYWDMGILDNKRMVAFSLIIVVLVLIVYLLNKFCLSRYYGLILDSIRENNDLVRNFVPIFRVKIFLFLWVGTGIAFSVGLLRGAYFGRINPDVFAIEMAVPILITTLIAGKRPEFSILAAAFYVIFPAAFVALFGMSMEGASNIREILWGIILIAIIIYMRRINRLKPGM